jgi:hypothetical protein
MSIETHPYAMIDPVCGKPAYFRVAVPIATDPLIAEDFEHIDGCPVHPADILACDSCGRYLAEDLFAGKLLEPSRWVRRDTLDSSTIPQATNETQDTN